MKTVILSNTDKIQFNANRAVVITSTDLAALPAGATGALALFSTTAHVKVGLAGVRIITPFAFSDGTITGMTGAIGDEDDADCYLVATELSAVGTAPTRFVLLGISGVYETAGQDVQISFAATDGSLDAVNVNSATSGKLVVYLSVEDLTQLPVPV